MAAHLHDSVLQTLALIQRHADEPPAGPQPGPAPGARAAGLALRRPAPRGRGRRARHAGRRARPARRRGRGRPRGRPGRGRDRGRLPARPRAWRRWSRRPGRRWSTRSSTAGGRTCRCSPRWRGPGRGVRAGPGAGLRPRGGATATATASPGRSWPGWPATAAGPRSTRAPGEGTEVVLSVACGHGGRAVTATRVFLVDDHRLFLSGVRAELAGRFEIVGEAVDVESAVEGIRAHGARRRAARRPPAGRRGPGRDRDGAAVAPRGGVPGAVGERRGRGRDRRHPGRGPRLRDEDDRRRRPGRRGRAGARGRRGVLAPAGRLRARRLRRRPPGRRAARPRARPDHPAGAGGPAPAGPGLHLQGDRPPAGGVDQDGRSRTSPRCSASSSCPAATS